MGKTYFAGLIESLPWGAPILVVAFGFCAVGCYVFLVFLWLLPKLVTSYVVAQGGPEAFRGNKVFEQFVQTLLIDDALS